ncbi:MAG: hypothetical protein EXR72_14480 [Myxococcales bacterium]|nr:hypothetical protein [Myxococcales bacterium]
MAKRPPIDLRGPDRRDFIKYSVAVGALFGLDRWKVFEATERTAGTALAAEMACAVTNRSVHIIAGDGGFAWFQLLWPHIDVAAAKNPAFAFHDPAGAVMAQNSDKPLCLGPQAPWQGLGPSKYISVYMSGSNETHKQNPTSSSIINAVGGTGLFASCAALQYQNPTLVPVIAVNSAKASMPYGAAAGAPTVVQVGSPDGMVGLFDSVASTLLGPLASQKTAALFEAYYKGFLGLAAAAGRPTYQRGFKTGKIAANLVGVNLAAQLRPTLDDLNRYGITLSTPTKLLDLAKGLITTARSFKLGLTSCVLLPAFNDDPHAAFADMTSLKMTVTTLGKMLDAFVKDLALMEDPTCAGTKIADNTVISIHGDTPKTPLVASGWPDGTPGDANWVYVLGAGWLRTGWFGGILRDGKFNGFSPATGNDVPGQKAAVTSEAAAGAIAYAVCKGDMRRVNDFYRGGDIAGIVRPKQM